MSLELTPGLMHTFARTQLHTDEIEYVVVGLSPEHIADELFLFSRLGVPFSTAVVDKDEVTLLLPWESWYQAREGIGAYDEARGYSLITFDTPADLELVGYIATLSTVLAEAGIPIISISAFTRDHILVQKKDLDRAVEVLSDFIADCQSRLAT